MTTQVYDSNLVFVSIAGRPIDSGRSESEFVSTEYNAEHVAETVGADGETTVARTNNNSGTIKIKLVQTSSGHTLLTQLYAMAKRTPGGALMDFEVRDINGAMLEHCECYFKKPPANPYGANALEREWTLGTGDLIREAE